MLFAQITHKSSFNKIKFVNSKHIKIQKKRCMRSIYMQIHIYGTILAYVSLAIKLFLFIFVISV